MLNQISWEMLHMVSLVLVEAFVEVAHGKLQMIPSDPVTLLKASTAVMILCVPIMRCMELSLIHI